MDHSDDGTTRRELLPGAGLAAAGTLAGCTSPASHEAETDYLTNVSSEMDGRGLREIRVDGAT
jgi:hypothetical protein